MRTLDLRLGTAFATVRDVIERYGVLLADPPWRYENWSDAVHGAAASAMETMSLTDLAAIPVGRWTSDDCVLALWATWPKLEDALALLEAWDFKYVTGFPWIKTCPSTGTIRRGIGFWTQGASEMLLIGRRGTPRLKPDRERVIGLAVGEERVLYAPRGKQHSQKPTDVHAWLEDSVAGPYLELFARRRYPDWTCWGLDLGYRLTPEGLALP